MKQWQFSLGLVPLLLATSVMADFSRNDSYALEPCINGGVSASGRFASQAAEDRYLADRKAAEHDPGMNGDVAAVVRRTNDVE